jgi:hypothetical protein
MYLFAREACGTGGYQCESGSYFAHGISGPGRCHSAFLNMMGYPMSTRDDMSHFVPRLMMATVYGPKGPGANQGINHGLGVSSEFCADMFPLVPDAWKPAALWAWNLHGGGHSERPDVKRLAEVNPVETFLHYPLDMKPEPPAGRMPKTWQAPDYGYYVFRNGWGSADDIILQAFPRARGYLGWGGPDAGTFRLFGLGHAWVSGNEGREVRRYLESVVLFPENTEFTDGRCATVTHVAAWSNGSGTVAADLSELCYDSSLADKKGDKRLYRLPWREQYGNVYHPGSAKPKAAHLRCYGADYSGLCGAPGLFALVDRIEGDAKDKLWLWQVDDVGAVRTEGSVFTIAKGDASLRGTFVAPGRAVVKAVQETRTSKKSAGSGAGEKDIQFTIKAVTARGEDPNEGRFFLVATLQRGAPPEVKVEGAGLGARVVVGGRTVAFDGTKIVFGTR